MVDSGRLGRLHSVGLGGVRAATWKQGGVFTHGM